MQRTSFQTPPSDVNNVAKCCNTLDDGTPTPIDSVKTGDNGFGGPSGSIRTCVKDLLRLYSVFLASANDQFANATTSTKGSPLKQVSHLMSAKIPMNQPTRGETSYGFGWARVQLPGTMGDIGSVPKPRPPGGPPKVSLRGGGFGTLDRLQSTLDAKRYASGGKRRRLSISPLSSR